MEEPSEEREEQQTKVIDEKFKDELLHKLDDLRKSNFLCDTTIRAEGQDFSAHRHVLSAASDYFKALFSSDLQENQSNLVELNEMKSTTVAEVLQFIYTGEVSISSSNAQDLVVASDYLIIPGLKSKAAQFLSGSINVSNCLVLESFASQYNCDSLRQAAAKYKCQQFVAFVKSEGFLSLGFAQVKELLCKDELNVSEEEQVYEAVMAWVKHDLPTRECFLPDLLKCLRLFSMSKYSLQKILSKEELITKSLVCMTFLINGMDFFLFPDRFLSSTLKHRISIDKEEVVVVLTGGEGSGGLCLDTECFSLVTKKWQSLSQVPYSCLAEDSIEYICTVCSGLLYGMDAKSARVSCFNPYDNSWTAKDTTLSIHGGATLTSCKEELYLIGGLYYNDEFDEFVKNEVYKYTPICNTWKQLASMESARARHCSVVLEDLIYVIAGYDGEDCLKSVENYNPLTNEWERSASLTNNRKGAAATSVGAKIFVVGGFANQSETNFEPTCEIFDPCVNQWSLVSASPTVPRAECGIVCVDETVYVFGGEDERTFLDTVECYDAKFNEWKQVDTSMPSARTRVQASLLRLPKRFFTK